MKIFIDIAELLTLEGADLKNGRRIQEADLGVIRDAALVCKHGRVEWAGPRSALKLKGETTSLDGATVLPGFVECHTHTVFAGDRAQEFEWRMQGQSYQEISAKGGGILSTVVSTRQAGAEELLQLAQKRVDRFVRQGVTLLETKSGYALDLENEIKCLQVARRLNGPRVVVTYLGAHSRSPDFPDLASYMRLMLETVLPRVAGERLADRVDIYIEKGFFDLESARSYLNKARELGLPVCAHVEQLSDFGGTALALAFTPQSIDHLVYLGGDALAAASRSDTTAVLLPTSDFYLKMRYPPARELIDAGARVALATDFNPGTSPTQELSLTGVLARIEMKMTLAEVIAAYTVNAAAALGKASDSGALVHGKRCDFAVLDCSWRDLFYSVGFHPVKATYVAGECIFKN